MKLISFCTRTIEYSFYSLFLLVPLVFNGGTSELFEFNKMWLAFGLTTVVASAWIIKMIAQRKISIQRTVLDIPLLLFFLSQIISTLFSMDQQVSWWGYYSRFNGGLLSTICYIVLYYAFVSNLELKHVVKTIKVSLIAGLLVALWGFPSHFGADPTCFMFRGSFDTSCWTDAFKPTIRAFSTLGQPAWFAAYLATLLPLAMAYCLITFKKNKLLFGSYLALTLLFYLDLIFANTRAGFIAFVAANVFFWAVVFVKKLVSKQLFIRAFGLFTILFIACNFFFGIPVNGLQKFTLSGLQNASSSQQNQQKTQQDAAAAAQPAPGGGSSITDSGDIRLHVWKGAIDAWKAHPLFGTGVETFAFAYYQYKPAGHNLTSEWDFLYNKAHNEYLNYLTTTGAFGLGTYLLFLGLFGFFAGKALFYKSEQAKDTQELHVDHKEHTFLIIALVAGWISILISNFFGFSVVIINLYLFLIPAFVLILSGLINPKKRFIFPAGRKEATHINPYQWTLIGVVILFAGYNCISLLQYWYADTQYALGTNYSRVGDYEKAYPLLVNAYTTKENEPTYSDELAMNLAIISSILHAQKQTEQANRAANNAIALDNKVISEHPNNIVFLKNRVRLFYALAQGDKEHEGAYYAEALKSIQRAAQLSPNDAKISYNLGILYGQTGNIDKAIDTLKQTIVLKPDYRDAYFALGLFYHEKAINKDGDVIDQATQQKAVDTYQYILKNLVPNDEEVKKSLKDWGA